MMLAVAGCQNAFSDDLGPLTGTWKVTITDFMYWPAVPQWSCDTETTYTIRQEGREIEGVSTDGVNVCTNTQTGAVDRLMKIAGVVRGPVENGHVHISDAGGFHCVAELHPTRMVGVLEAYGSGPDGVGTKTWQSGTCVLEKISDAGYTGPRA